MPCQKPNAIEFIRTISQRVYLTLPENDPIDTAKALVELGYIKNANDSYQKTSLGENELIPDSIADLTNDVIDLIRSGLNLDTERFKCYICARVNQKAYFGPRCQFETIEDERYRVSISPCTSCLSHYHATH